MYPSIRSSVSRACGEAGPSRCCALSSDSRCKQQDAGFVLGQAVGGDIRPPLFSEGAIGGRFSARPPGVPGDPGCRVHASRSCPTCGSTGPPEFWCRVIGPEDDGHRPGNCRRRHSSRSRSIERVGARIFRAYQYPGPVGAVHRVEKWRFQNPLYRPSRPKASNHRWRSSRDALRLPRKRERQHPGCFERWRAAEDCMG